MFAINAVTVHDAVITVAIPTQISRRRATNLSSLRSIIHRFMNWIATNARSFSYLLPDTVELALYLCLIAYFTTQFAQQQMLINLESI